MAAISIHASRGGSDQEAHKTIDGVVVISIHASRGGSDDKLLLNPTHETAISIHASRGGSDHAIHQAEVSDAFDFNPRFPRGKRPYWLLWYVWQ